MKASYRSKAAIVCEHIGNYSAIIKRAIHDEPLAIEDSGWQFTCGQNVVENERNAAVWSLAEIIELEPSVAPWIELIDDLDTRIILERTTEFEDWHTVVEQK